MKKKFVKYGMVLTIIIGMALSVLRLCVPGGNASGGFSCGICGKRYYVAREIGSEREAGHGLVDYAYAERMYDVAERQMENGREVSVPENQAEIQVFDNRGDVERLEEKENGEVEGSWDWEVHREYLDKKNINLPAMRAGVVYPDKEESFVYSMKVCPDFHGYFQTQEEKEVNYIASYHFMINIADAYGRGKDYASVFKVKGLTDTSYREIRRGFKEMNKKIKSYASNKDRKAFAYGIAMHTATDVFAHSTMQKWNGRWQRIKHGEVSKGYGADKTYVQPRRYTMALRVERNIIYRYQGKRTDVPVMHDFHASGDENGTYYTMDATDKRSKKNKVRAIRLYAGSLDNITFTIYKSGKKTAEKQWRFHAVQSGGKAVKYKSKKYVLKDNGTYYIKVSKANKKTNGAYKIGVK